MLLFHFVKLIAMVAQDFKNRAFVDKKLLVLKNAEHIVESGSLNLGVKKEPLEQLCVSQFNQVWASSSHSDKAGWLAPAQPALGVYKFFLLQIDKKGLVGIYLNAAYREAFRHGWHFVIGQQLVFCRFLSYPHIGRQVQL